MIWSHFPNLLEIVIKNQEKKKPMSESGQVKQCTRGGPSPVSYLFWTTWCLVTFFCSIFNGYKVSITFSNYLQSQKEKGNSIIRTTWNTECTGARKYCFV
jgi:hypothetical protein